MEKTYNLELTEEEIELLNSAIWLHYHSTMEDLKNKVVLDLRDYEIELMNKDLVKCEELIDRLKNIKK